MKWTHAIAVAVLAIGLAACQKPKQVQPESGQPAGSTDSSGAQTSGLDTEGGAGSGGEGAAMGTAQEQALAALKTRSVIYFEYDSSEIRAEYVQVVAAHAAYLTKFPTAKVRLEGHTDERGSREYNIGLGERRAQTVRRALQLQGVADPQVTTVSYGEERPAVEGSDEAVYAQNRRVELAYAP
jgi:peptidoglycan-associated lipoprotein